MLVPSGSHKYHCSKCDTKIPICDLEDIFQDQLRRLLFERPELFGEPPSEDEEFEDAKEQLETVRRELKSTKSEMSKYEHLFAAGEFSVERFGEVHSPLEAKRKELSEKLKNLSRKKSKEKTESSSNFQTLAENWPSLPLKDKRAILEALVDQITIAEGQIEFHCTFPDRFEESSKDATDSQQTENPTNEGSFSPNEPIYIRLPKSGEKCPLTGLSSSKLYDLIQPSDRNAHRAPVKSLSLKLPGRARGTRLIGWASLKAYLASQLPNENGDF